MYTHTCAMEICSCAHRDQTSLNEIQTPTINECGSTFQVPISLAMHVYTTYYIQSGVGPCTHVCTCSLHTHFHLIPLKCELNE